MAPDPTPASSVYPEKLNGKIYADYKSKVEDRKYFRAGYIYFDTKESGLSSQARRELKRLAVQVKLLVDLWYDDEKLATALRQELRKADHLTFYINVVGHHDKRRSKDPSNAQLALGRAESVAGALVDQFTSWGESDYAAAKVQIPVTSTVPVLTGKKGRLFVFYRGEDTPDPKKPVREWDQYDRSADIDAHGVLGTSLLDDYLLFDGKHLRWMKKDVEHRKWAAVSGADGYQTKDFQTVKNKGPLPEGLWEVKQSRHQRIGNRGVAEQLWNEVGRGKWPGGESAWGKNRIWLEADPLTETHRRSGFSIHGGDDPGSAGCIDMTDKMPDFTTLFLQHQKDMLLKVEY